MTNNSECKTWPKSLKIHHLFIQHKILYLESDYERNKVKIICERFYELDNFDIKNLIESLFEGLTVEQKTNLIKQLGDTVNAKE